MYGRNVGVANPEVPKTKRMKYSVAYGHMNAHPGTKSMEKTEDGKENIGMKNLLYKQQP